MTNQTNNTDSTTDKPAEQVEKPAQPDKKTPRTRHKRSSHFSMTTWLLLILLGLAGYGIWYVTGIIKQQQQTALALSAQLTQAVQAQTNQLEQQAQRNTQYETAIKDLKNSLENLLQTNRHLKRDWLIAEAGYLIKLANHRLILMRDIETSIVALKAADQRLSEIGDPLLIHLRQEIHNDIQSLNGVTKVDSVGISLTLNAVSNQIQTLPLRTRDPKAVAKNNADSAAVATTTWRDLPAAMWEDIKNMFTVRHHDQPIQKLLTPTQQFFVAQSVALQLEQSRLAVMNGQTEIYQDRLRNVAATIRDYYDIESEITRRTLATLDELAQKNIHQQLPDISNSLKQINNYMQQANTPPVVNPVTSSDKGSKAAPAKATQKKTAKPGVKSKAKPAAAPVSNKNTKTAPEADKSQTPATVMDSKK